MDPEYETETGPNGTIKVIRKPVPPVIEPKLLWCKYKKLSKGQRERLLAKQTFLMRGDKK